MADVLSPDGTIGVNAVAEIRSDITSAQFVYLDIYKNDILVFSVRPTFKITDTEWVGGNGAIEYKKTTSGANYNELEVKVVDQDTNEWYIVRVRVFNNAVAIRMEQLSYGNYLSQFVAFSGFDFTNEVVIIPTSTSQFFEDILERTTYGNVAAGTRVPAFVIFPSKKATITQLTLEVALMSMWKDNVTSELAFMTYPDVDNPPASIPIGNTDWLGIVFWDKINDVYDILSEVIPTLVTVKTYDVQHLRFVDSYTCYQNDINDTKIQALADVASDVGLDGVTLASSWSVSGSATQVDTARFTDWQGTLDYIKNKDLKVNLAVLFEDIVNEGISNCVSTWTSWNIDVIKIGFWITYVNNTNDNYDGVQKLRQLVQELYNNGIPTEIHELNMWCLPFEFENCFIEAYPEAAEATYWNVIKHYMLRVTQSHDLDLNGTVYENTDYATELSIDSAITWTYLFTTMFNEVALEEWDTLDENTQNAIRHILSLKEFANEIYYYDDRIEGYGDITGRSIRRI